MTPTVDDFTTKYSAVVIRTLRTNPDLRRATVFHSPDLTVKATRQRRLTLRSPDETYLVTIGTLNYAERQFIKKCQKAGEPFPVKKVQLKFWPPKRRGS